jgi:L-asparaginase type II
VVEATAARMILRPILRIALSALALRAAPPAGAQSAKPRVLIVATGGTIASTNYYSATPGHISVDALLKAVPGLDSLATISTQRFSNVGSSAMTTAMWPGLSRSISDTLRARPDLSDVIVTHGTDTMEETAYFLDLTVADPRPVIVAGAMRPSDGVGADGPANLYNAVRVATPPSARSRGAMIVLNDEILAARDAQKTNSVRPNAFSAPYRGDLGLAEPEGLVFHRPASRRQVFDISGVRDLPRVDIVYSYAGADGADIDAFVAAGAKGIVVAATGRGNIPPLQNQAVDRALAKGVVVVVGTRTGSGSVPVGNGARVIGTGDLNVAKARVLLILALTQSSDRSAVAKIFQAHQ